jgi:nucleoid-associated protein YgaU
MSRDALMVAGLAGALALSGCRAPTRMATRVTEVPRVDLALEGGNRGYLVGTAPAAEAQKTTRQIVHTDVEVPSFYRPKHGAAPPAPAEEPAEEAAAPDIAPPEVETEPEQQWSKGPEPAVEEPEERAAPSAQPSEVYLVKRGDSLWSIAAKPEVYGKATMWRKLFDANRDLLKSPDRLRAGMKLKVPRGRGGGDSGMAYDDGGTYQK